jgi:predicted small secreted protein
MMKLSLKRLALLLLTATLVVFAVTGCQTANGLGKDVEKLGEKIQDKTK